MNSFKRSKLQDDQDGYRWDITLHNARLKAKRDIFMQKVQCNLIMGVVLIVIFCIFFR